MLAVFRLLGMNEEEGGGGGGFLIFFQSATNTTTEIIARGSFFLSSFSPGGGAVKGVLRRIVSTATVVSALLPSGWSRLERERGRGSLENTQSGN